MTAATKPEKATKASKTSKGRKAGGSTKPKATKPKAMKPKATKPKAAQPNGDFDYAGSPKLATMLDRYSAGEKGIDLNAEIDLNKFPAVKRRVPVMELMRRHFAQLHGLKRNSTEFWKAWGKSELGPMFHRERAKAAAPAKPNGKGTKPSKGKAQASAPSASDKGVKVIKGTPAKEGWKVRKVKGAETVVSPEGNRYAFAAANQKADLIVKDPKGGKVVRLKLIEKGTPSATPKK